MINYRTETEMICFQGKMIPVENRIPDYSEQEAQTVRQEVEQQLFSIFQKYSKPNNMQNMNH